MRHWHDGAYAGLAPLDAALAMQQAAAAQGFDWTEIAPLWDKLHEEMTELQDAVRSGEAAEITGELGDLLFMLVNLARHLGVAPDQALAATNQKFLGRMGFIEAQLSRRGRTLAESSMDELEALWQQAKCAPRQG